MRIRKNAKLSSLLLFSQASSGPETPPPPTHVCQLNQSPWDVIPFSSLHHQLDEQDFGIAANGSSDGAMGAVQSSAASMMVVDDMDIPKQESGFNFNSDDNDLTCDDNDRDDSDVSYGAKAGGLAVKSGCRKTNGKGWQCARAAKEGHYLCEHHLKKSQTHNTNTYGGAATKKGGPPGMATAPPQRPGRGRPPKKSHPKSAKSNQNQFYYYSGFGPSWGKRRNERGPGGVWESPPAAAKDEGSCRSSTPTSPSSLQIDGDGIDDYDMDDEDEVDGGGAGGRKRTRKPVKARSLKSLM